MSSASTPPLPSGARHYAWLDWIRFLASLLVVLAHVRYRHFADYPQLQIPGKGPLTDVLFLIPSFANEAVMIFFVLSGFLVGGRCLERLLNGTFEARNYALDRVTRIWIPLIPAIILTWMAEAICGSTPAFLNGLENIVALQEVTAHPMTNNAPLWTLSYEIWFYVLAFAAGLLITGKTRATKTLAMLLACAVMVAFMRLKPLYLFLWMMGAFAYLVPGKRNAWLQLAIGLGAMLCGTVLSALTTELSTIARDSLPFSLPRRDTSLSILGIGFALSLPVLVASVPRSRWGTRVEALGTRLAAFSFSLYLSHWPLLFLWSHFEGGRKFDSVNLGSVSLYFLKVLTCVAFGVLFYLAFEKHTARVRRWLADRFLARKV